MALSYKTRKRLALLVLVLGLPIYIGVAWFVMGRFERLSFWLELLVYIGLGIIWAIPLKALFKGIGQADPYKEHEDLS